jgi:hypothetical protein
VWAYMGPLEKKPAPPEVEWCTLPASHVFVSKRDTASPNGWRRRESNPRPRKRYNPISCSTQIAPQSTVHVHRRSGVSHQKPVDDPEGQLTPALWRRFIKVPVLPPGFTGRLRCILVMVRIGVLSNGS